MRFFTIFIFMISFVFGDNFVSFSDDKYNTTQMYMLKEPTELEKKLIKMKKDDPNKMYIIDNRTGEIIEIIGE